ERAATLLDGLCAGARGLPGQHAVFVMNRGIVFLRAGDVRRAAALLGAVAASGWLEGEYAASLYRGLTVTPARLGPAGGADARRERAIARTVVERRDELTLADVLLDLRRGRPEAALATIASRGKRAGELIPAYQRRQLEVLRAFALAQTGDRAGAREVLRAA